MKYQFMQQHEKEFSIERMSPVFEVSRSGYYCFVNAKLSIRVKENEKLLEKIKAIYTTNRRVYGSPRIYNQLREEGENCSRKRIAKLMKNKGIRAKMNKAFKVTTKANQKAIAASNLLQQDFTATEPNQKWVADITYIYTQQGWLYLAAVLDLYSRRIVGLAMSERMTDDLIIKALQQAIIHRTPLPGLIHHSDKGSQYTSKKFQQLLKIHQIIPSMSGTSNCYDNAAMESFFHTLKTEHVYFEQYATREQAKQSIFEYVEVFYNRQRKHSPLGYLSPVIFENRAQQQINIFLPCVH